MISGYQSENGTLVRIDGIFDIFFFGDDLVQRGKKNQLREKRVLGVGTRTHFLGRFTIFTGILKLNFQTFSLHILVYFARCIIPATGAIAVGKIYGW